MIPQRHDPATGLFGQRGRWDAAKQRRWVAQQRAHPEVVTRGEPNSAADLVWLALGFTLGVIFGVLLVAAYIYHRTH